MNRPRPIHLLRTPEMLCPAVVLLLGTVLALLTPPLQSPDEGAHLFRLWQISTGGLVARDFGGDVPLSILQFNGVNQPRWLQGRRTGIAPVLQNFHQALHPGKTQWLVFASAALYSPLPYLPQTLGVLIGRLLDAPPIVLMYLGRLANVMVYALLGWAAVRVTPVLKWTTAIVLLSPLPLFLAGTLSADPVTIGLGLLATALLLRMMLAPAPITWRAVAATAACLAGVGLCKSVYVPIAALVFAVPAGKFPSRQRRWHATLAILLATLLPAAGWSALANPMNARQRGGPPANQLHWIMQHPIAYTAVCGRTLERDGTAVLISTIGVLGWLDTVVGRGYTAGYFVLILWMTLNDADAAERIRLLPRLIAAAAVAVSLLAIATSIYMLWEKPGEPYLEGVQGRYALPLALLTAVVIRSRGRWPIPPTAIAALLILGAAHTVWIVLLRYYFL
jgi:uncharacterized membrane protein